MQSLRRCARTPLFFIPAPAPSPCLLTGRWLQGLTNTRPCARCCLPPSPAPPSHARARPAGHAARCTQPCLCFFLASSAQVFGKDRAAFQALPAWRQQMAKKDKGLW